MTLHIITHKNWMAQDLDATQSFGFDLPALTPGDDQVWMPEFYAARYLHSGVELPLSTTVGWHNWLPETMLRRRVTKTILFALTQQPDVFGYVKLEDLKDDRAAAQWTSTHAYAELLIQLGAPGGTGILVADTLHEIAVEWRAIVAGGVVLDYSCYIDNQRTGASSRVGDRGAMDGRIAEFAQQAAGRLPEHMGTCALDVAELADGSLMVIEANPIWCANWYSADPQHVRAALQQEWATGSQPSWEPDAWLAQRVQGQFPQ